MSGHATLTVTSGPQRGQVFELTDEMTQLGRGGDAQVALTDPQIEPQQAVIVNRGGRYAIYTPLDGTVEVDGQVIPSERWVWLPEIARLRVSKATAMQFNTTTGQTSVPVQPVTGSGPAPPPPQPNRSGTPQANGSAQAPAPPPKQRRRRKQAAAKQTRDQVARFITDESGDSLVKLGEDGELPELALADTTGKPKAARPKNETKSGMYMLLGFSVLCSCLLMLIDFEPPATSQSERNSARREIQEFLPVPGRTPERWQEHLIDARLAYRRGDRAAEVRAYHQVINMLHAEDTSDLTGLTGNKARDERLQTLIGKVIAPR